MLLCDAFCLCSSTNRRTLKTDTSFTLKKNNAQKDYRDFSLLLSRTQVCLIIVVNLPHGTHAFVGIPHQQNTLKAHTILNIRCDEMRPLLPI